MAVSKLFYLFIHLIVSIGFINCALFDKNAKKACPEPYSQCNLGKEGMINVHIVPHTHDDVG